MNETRRSIDGSFDDVLVQRTSAFATADRARCRVRTAMEAPIRCMLRRAEAERFGAKRSFRRCSTKPITRIAGRLGTTRDEARAFCAAVKTASAPGSVPNDFDIARALEKTGTAKPTIAEVATIASKMRAGVRAENKLRRLRESAKRQKQAGARKTFQTFQTRKQRPPVSRCRFCGRPAVAGSELCYGCSA